ncbi:DUF4369 domain-containing protein [Marinilabiliaceae bacterium JC017]|nr:DUF4369 domain-containing protein [Marinilabiliaceae bacterium JC017]
MQYLNKAIFMKNYFLILIIPILLLNCSPSEQESTCVITGKIVGRDSKTLILIKKTKDARYCGEKIQIDSTGHFSYILKNPSIEAYELIFKDEHDRGSWRPIMFFPDDDTIQFTLYPREQYDQNQIEGGVLAKRIVEFNRKLANHPIRYQIDYWYQQQDSIEKKGIDNIEYSKLISKKLDSLFTAGFHWQVDYFWKEQNIFGYSMFLNNILTQDYRRKWFSIDTLKTYSKLFSDKFPNHPYNEIAENIFNALENIVVGRKCINFSAPDSMGVIVNLSSEISKNKLTLIDLWSPWCGPCIRKSQKVVPIFNEFKDSGFAVISVVGGIRNQEQYTSTFRRYNYPWNVLSEIKNKDKIWENIIF